ncbi:hypothetical protein [Streptomyces sp. C184]|uniref:hypothetical protein n=1 Tax=Streptomyces sp. C184 TaxID=3237121 RepID=UPI0034C5E040
MTTARETDRRRFAAAVAEAAEVVAAVLGAYQSRGNEPYPIAAVLPTLAEQHQVLQELVYECEGPLTLDAAGKEDPFIGDLAALMSYLQLLRVLYHGFDVIPGVLQVNASRNIAAVHLAGRRVRDRARRQAK